MQGDLVIVRAYGGKPLVRRIWAEDETGIYITDDNQLKRLIAGKSAIPPIGFPKEDVFKYDPSLAAAIDDVSGNGGWDWNKLTPF